MHYLESHVLVCISLLRLVKIGSRTWETQVVFAGEDENVFWGVATVCAVDAVIGEGMTGGDVSLGHEF